MAGAAVGNQQVPGLDVNENAGFEVDKYGSQFHNLDRQYYIIERMAKAVEEPKQYFKNRAIAFNGIRNKSRAEFEASFKSYVKKGVSKDESKRLAEKYVNNILSAMMSEFDAEWPAHIGDLAFERLVRNADTVTGVDLNRR